MRFAFLILFAALVTTTSRAQTDSIADSLALLVYEAAGGADVWSRVPYIGFSYVHVIDRTPSREVRHLWNRQTNQYRLEVMGPSGEPYVILFDVDTGEGKAYWAGDELVGQDLQQQLDFARLRFVHDTYWLLAPLKLFDPGVERVYVADSSDEAVDVLKVKFSIPGHAPAEEYWFHVNKQSRLIVLCTYWAPQDAPDVPPRQFVWHGYRQLRTRHGNLVLSTQKSGVGTSSALVTENIWLPSSLPEDMFDSSEPRLISAPSSAQ